MKLASVVIRTYNRAHMIKDALNSLVAQDFPKEQFQVIVINDNSTDNTEDVITEHRGLLDIKYIKHKENKGTAATMETGINAAESKYVLFLDDDDMFAPNMISSCVDLMEKDESLSLVYTGLSERNNFTGEEKNIHLYNYGKKLGGKACIEISKNRLGFFSTCT